MRLSPMAAALMGIPPIKITGKPGTTPAPVIEVFPPEMMHALHGDYHPAKHLGEGSEPRVFPCVVID